MTTPQADWQCLMELKEAPCKGLGLFARRALKKGTRVLAEEGVFGTQISGEESEDLDDAELMLRFDDLPEAQQTEYLKLHCFSRGQDFRALFENNPYISENEIDLYVKVCEIRRANTFGDVYLIGSRFNHSCLPNISWDFNSNLSKMTFHTTRDIAESEELTVVYDDVFRPRAIRCQELKDKFGFDCNYEVCEATSAREEKEKWRVLLHTLLKQYTALYRHKDTGHLAPEHYDGARRLAQRMASIAHAEGLMYGMLPQM